MAVVSSVCWCWALQRGRLQLMHGNVVRHRSLEFAIWCAAPQKCCLGIFSGTMNYGWSFLILDSRIRCNFWSTKSRSNCTAENISPKLISENSNTAQKFMVNQSPGECPSLSQVAVNNACPSASSRGLKYAVASGADRRPNFSLSPSLNPSGSNKVTLCVSPALPPAPRACVSSLRWVGVRTWILCVEVSLWNPKGAIDARKRGQRVDGFIFFVVRKWACLCYSLKIEWKCWRLYSEGGGCRTEWRRCYGNREPREICRRD